MAHGKIPGQTTIAATPGSVVQMNFEAGRKIPLYKFDSAVYVPARDIDDTWEGEADAKEELERMEMGDGDTTPESRTSSSEGYTFEPYLTTSTLSNYCYHHFEKRALFRPEILEMLGSGGLTGNEPFPAL